MRYVQKMQVDFYIIEKKMQNEELLTVEEIREKLSDRRLAVVADRIGMTYACLSRVMRGGQPTKRTIRRVQEYLEKNNG